jgi:hypothetical protein
MAARARRVDRVVPTRDPGPLRSRSGRQGRRHSRPIQSIRGSCGENPSRREQLIALPPTRASAVRANRSNLAIRRVDRRRCDQWFLRRRRDRATLTRRGRPHAARAAASTTSQAGSFPSQRRSAERWSGECVRHRWTPTRPARDGPRIADDMGRHRRSQASQNASAARLPGRRFDALIALPGPQPRGGRTAKWRIFVRCRAPAPRATHVGVRPK